MVKRFSRDGFLATALLTLAFSGLTATRSFGQAAPVGGPTAPAVQAVVPAVDAKIVGLYPSPDHRQVALLLNRGTDEHPEVSLVMFDPEAGRVLGETARQRLSESSDSPFTRVEPVEWSCDNRWAAMVGEHGRIVLIGRNGECRTVPSSYPATFVVWRGDKPGYVIDGMAEETPWYLHETEVATGKGRRIPLRHIPSKRRPSDLFIVHGKPWVAFRTQNDSAIRVAQADPWRPRFDVPLGRYVVYDLWKTDVSPDGEYFYCKLLYSASTLDVVGRVKEAGIVFRQPLRAIFWQQDIEGPIVGVDWLQEANGRSRLDEPGVRVAVVETCSAGPDDPPFVLSLDTGSRNRLLWGERERLQEFREVVLWKPHEIFPHGWNTYLGLSEAGLEIFNDRNEPPRRLLLRQAEAVRGEEEAQ